jgi:hypothetical protein
VLAREPGHGGTRHENPADGSACKGGHASLPSALAPNRRWLLACRLSLATPLGPRIALRRAPPHEDIYEGGRLGVSVGDGASAGDRDHDLLGGNNGDYSWLESLPVSANSD